MACLPPAGTIDSKDLEDLLRRLSPPLGLGQSATNTDVLRFVYSLDIPLIDLRVPFHKTLYELVRRCSGARMPEGEPLPPLLAGCRLACALRVSWPCPAANPSMVNVPGCQFGLQGLRVALPRV